MAKGQYELKLQAAGISDVKALQALKQQKPQVSIPQLVWMVALESALRTISSCFHPILLPKLQPPTCYFDHILYMHFGGLTIKNYLHRP